MNIALVDRAIVQSMLGGSSGPSLDVIQAPEAHYFSIARGAADPPCFRDR